MGEVAVVIAVLASVVSLIIIMVLTYRDPLLAGHRGARMLAAGAWVASYGVMWLRTILDEVDPARDLWAWCLVLGGVCLVTYGRPVLVMEMLFPAERRPGHSAGLPPLSAQLRRRSRRAQWVLVVGIIVVVFFTADWSDF
jgi:hypothetical protein